MLKEIIYIVTDKPLVRDFINCCLRYAFSQPIEIDLNIFFFFAIQYLGLEQVKTCIEKAKSYYNAYYNHSVDEKESIKILA